MSAGFSGTFAIPVAQTDLDGLRAPTPSDLRPGATWRWQGPATRLDGPQSLLRLDHALGLDRLRARIRTRFGTTPASPFEEIDPILRHGFSVTDGRAVTWLALIETGRAPLLVCHDGLPPENTDLWVVRVALSPPRPAPLGSAPMTGLAGACRIETPDGPRRADALRPGDRVLTRDAGAQPILWTCAQSLSRARLMLMPHLRPLRDRSAEVLLAPQQMVAVSGAAATALFGSPDVLAEARALPRDWRRDHSLHPVSYIQIVLPRHHLLRTEGCDVASTHPADLSPDSLPLRDRARLAYLWPDPQAYGPYARRVLSAPEAALMQAA